MALLDTIKNDISDDELISEFNVIKEKEESIASMKDKLKKYFHSKMLPFYKKAFTKLLKYNLFESPRSMGKSVNVTYGSLTIALEKDLNILVLRKTKDANKDSIYLEFSEKLTDAWRDLELPSRFLNIKGTEIILFPKTDEAIRIAFDGSYNPSRLKGKKGFHIIITEESDEFNQDDFIKIFPTFRDPSRPDDIVFLCLTNVPKKGKQHFLYHMFIEDPKPKFRCFSPRWQDNIVQFKTEADWQEWIDDNAPAYYGREKALSREIYGEWLDSEYAIFKHVQSIQAQLPPTHWVNIEESGVSYWLGVHATEDRVIIAKEAFGMAPPEVKSAVTLLRKKGETYDYEQLRALRELIGAGRFTRLASTNEVASRYASRTLEIWEGCKYALREAKVAEWDVKEGSTLVDRALKPDTEGLFVQAMRYVVGFFG